MSARMLLEILAGQMTIDDSVQNDQMQHIQNPFRINLQQGQLINEITVELHPDKDDDRVTIRFGYADSAIDPFTCDQTRYAATAAADAGPGSQGPVNSGAKSMMSSEPQSPQHLFRDEEIVWQFSQ